MNSYAMRCSFPVREVHTGKPRWPPSARPIATAQGERKNPSLRFQGLFDLTAECRRVNRRIAVEIVLDLREEGQGPCRFNEPPGEAFAPARERRDEVIRRSQLDVDGELVLQSGNHSQKLFRAGLELDVHVDAGPSPAHEYGGGTASEVEAARRSRVLAEPDHELQQSFSVRRLAPSAARSKPTRGRRR